MTIRFGAKAPAERRNRELEATSTQTWSQCPELVYETEPELVGTVRREDLLPFVHQRHDDLSVLGA